MSDTKSIIDSIREISKGANAFGVMCTVKSIDSSNKLCDCTPVDESADILEVKLMASNSEGFYVLPKVGSYVVVSLTSESTGFISMFSEVDEIQLNGDNFGGLTKIDDVVAKLNQVENDLNTLKSVFSSWITVPNDGGAALKAGAATWYGSSITPTVNGDLENTTVKQGDGT